MSQLTSLISTVRHGKKDSEGNLESVGKNQSARRAIDIEHLQGDLILFHSGEGRVRDTIRIIGANLHKNDPSEIEEFFEEEHDLQDYIVPTLHFLKNRQVKSSYFASWNKEGDLSLMSDFIESGTNFSDTEAAYNSFEMAQNLTKIIFTQMQFSLLTSEESRANFINGTHEPVIASFLYYALQGFAPTVTPAVFFTSLGGSIQYAEGFDVKIYQDNHIFEKAVLQFRNAEIEISPTTLSDFLK